MIIYLITICVSCLLAYFAEKTGHIDKNGKMHFNTKYVVALIIFLCVVSGFRYMNYYQSDEYNYRIGIDSMKNENILNYIEFKGEWIFQLLSWISANVFKNNQFLILFTATITNLSFILFFTKNTKSLSLVVFLYIAGGAYFSSMNVLRQYLAAAITIWCFDLALNKKILKYILLVIIASGIHQSAWIMLPLYPVLTKKRIDKISLIIIGVTLILFFNFQTIITSILSSGTMYDHYLDGMLSNGYGVKLIRILTFVLPYSILIIKMKLCENELKMKPYILVSVLISMCIAIISYQYVYFARIDIYFAIVALCGIARIPELFENESEFYAKISMVILFFIFGAYQMSISPTYHNILFENISGVL